MKRLILRALDRMRRPVLGMTLRQQDEIRNCLLAVQGILLASRNHKELHDQDYQLVLKRFEKVYEVIKIRERIP